MSTTEHDLASGKSGDALDELLDDDEFDDAMNDALDEADVELELGDDDSDDPADAEARDVDDVVDEDDLDDLVDADEARDADDEADDDVTSEVIAAPDDDDPVDAEARDVDDVADVDDLDDAVDGEKADAELDSSDDDDPVDAEARDVDDVVDVDEVDGEAETDVEEPEAATDDGSEDADAGEFDDGTARHGIRPATVVVDVDETDDDFELPEIVPATPDVDDDDRPVAVRPLEAREYVPAGDPGDEELDEADELEDDAVSDEILEELRRADIDGPVVDLAPQDDTAARRRRPRRRADYDPAPMPIPAQIPRVLGRKPRVRKVTRVVRHVDPWSVFKIALVAHVVLYIIVLTAGVLLWNVAHATGTVDNVERFFESFGWAEFEFDGGEIYHASWIAGLFLVIGFTGLAVLAATLFNLITDLVGGMRFTVLEEEVVETRVSPMRRFVVRRPEPEVPAVLRDESGAMIREAVVDDTGANERPSR